MTVTILENFNLKIIYKRVKFCLIAVHSILLNKKNAGFKVIYMCQINIVQNEVISFTFKYKN